MKKKIDILARKDGIKTYANQNQQWLYLPDKIRKAIGISGQQRLPLLVFGFDTERHLVICGDKDAYKDKNGDNGFTVRHFDIASISTKGHLILPFKAREKCHLTRWNSYLAYAIQSVDGSKRIILIPKTAEKAAVIYSDKAKIPSRNAYKLTRKWQTDWLSRKEKIPEQPSDPFKRKPVLTRGPKSKKYVVPAALLINLRWSIGCEVALFKIYAPNGTVKKIVIIASAFKKLSYDIEDDESMEEFCRGHISNSRQISFHPLTKPEIDNLNLPHGYIHEDNDGHPILVLTA